MDSIDQHRRVNVLCLDGGGVRGLSTLIILSKLLCFVNFFLHPLAAEQTDEPFPFADIFDLVVGTSTGGLIALMLVKLRMSLTDCIEAYKTLSKCIFGHRNRFALGGFGRVKKYSGKNLEGVLFRDLLIPKLGKQLAKEYYLEDTLNHPLNDCAVVCREVTKKRLRRKAGVVHLCTQKCRAANPQIGQYTKIKLAEAARATSAAPTYFEAIELLGKLLIDGGYGRTNNPSETAFNHHIKKADRYERVQFVNIGTGSPPEDYDPDQNQDWIDRLPNFLVRGFIRQVKDLAEIATDSEEVAETMRSMAKNITTLKFERFSVNHSDIHRIELFDYQKLGEIEQLTNKWLEKPEVLSKLEKTAGKLAKTWRLRQSRSHADVCHLLPHTQVTTPIIVEATGVTEMLERAPSPALSTAPSGLSNGSSVVSSSGTRNPSIIPLTLPKDTAGADLTVVQSTAA